MDSLIICGSQRKNSQSIRIANIIHKLWSSLDQSAEVIELANENIPFAESEWNESAVEKWDEIAAKVKAADSIILVSPEWGGMATPAIKNFLLLCDHHLVGHKPCLIVTVSSGSGGAYPAAEIRASSLKDNKICFIPENLIIRDVANVFTNNPEKESLDQYISRRALFCLHVLSAYATALKSVRQNDLFFIEDYQYGM